MTAVGFKRAPRWEEIDTVLLDMDGTLLDRHFDDHFWLEHVPLRYAEQNDMTSEQAKDKLFKRFRAEEGTLNWTNLDFWSEQLGLDIPALKRQVDHLIDVHPYVLPFLDRVRETGRAILMVTNAHSKTLDLKMGKTALAGKFDEIFNSHQLGAPKEDPAFWEELGRRVDYDPASTLLAEDTLVILETAARFGIRYPVYVARYSSTVEPRPSKRFFSIEFFREIMP